MLIGICGKMGSGKDTLANNLSYLLYKNEDYELFITSFAKSLKNICRRLFNVDKKDARGREILQLVGEYMRKIDPDVWINTLLKEIREYKKIQHYIPIIVVTDVRYMNEAQAILDEGGYIICLDACEENRKSRISKRDGHVDFDAWDRAKQHKSEIDSENIFKMKSERLYIVDANQNPDEVCQDVMNILFPEKKD